MRYIPNASKTHAATVRADATLRARRADAEDRGCRDNELPRRGSARREAERRARQPGRRAHQLDDEVDRQRLSQPRARLRHHVRRDGAGARPARAPVRAGRPTASYRGRAGTDAARGASVARTTWLRTRTGHRGAHLLLRPSRATTRAWRR